MLCVSRRSLGGMAGLAGLVVTTSACEPWRGTATPAVLSPDAAVVQRVVAAVRRARDVATVAGEATLVALHETHLRALGEEVVASPSATPTIAPLALSTSESTLKTTLTAAALEVEDGSLARTLASMAASVAQHLVALR